MHFASLILLNKNKYSLTYKICAYLCEIDRKLTILNTLMNTRLWSRLTCSCTAARWDPPGRWKQSCHHLIWKQGDMSLYLQQVEHQGEEDSDREEDETPPDQVGDPAVVQRAAGAPEHRGDDGHHLLSFCKPVRPWWMLSFSFRWTGAAPAALLQSGHLALNRDNYESKMVL